MYASSNWPVIIRREGGGSGGTSAQTQAVALGLGSLFNHSALDQNVGWERDVVAQCITYTALRDIRAGEELYVVFDNLVLSIPQTEFRKHRSRIMS